jgi:hypothetical protein
MHDRPSSLNLPGRPAGLGDTAMEDELDAQKRRTTGEHEASNIAIGQRRHEHRVLNLGDTQKFRRGAEEMV